MSFLRRLFGRRAPKPDPRELLESLSQFIRADTWTASQRIVEQHPELLSDEADGLLGQLIAAQDNPQAVQALTEHRTLLRRCREIGIPAAFAEHTSPSPGGGEGRGEGEAIPDELRPFLEMMAALPEAQREALARIFAQANSPEDVLAALAEQPELQAAIQSLVDGAIKWSQIPFFAEVYAAEEAESQYLHGAGLRALHKAVGAWTRILDHPTFAASDLLFRLSVWENAGCAFLHRYWAQGRSSDLGSALSLLQMAVTFTEKESPDLPSRLNNLANGLSSRYSQTLDLGFFIEIITQKESGAEGGSGQSIFPSQGNVRSAVQGKPWLLC